MLDGCQLDSIHGDWKVDPAEDDNPFTLVSVQKNVEYYIFSYEKNVVLHFFPHEKNVIIGKRRGMRCIVQA